MARRSPGVGAQGRSMGRAGGGMGTHGRRRGRPPKVWFSESGWTQWNRPRGGWEPKPPMVKESKAYSWKPGNRPGEAVGLFTRWYQAKCAVCGKKQSPVARTEIKIVRRDAAGLVYTRSVYVPKSRLKFQRHPRGVKPPVTCRCSVSRWPKPSLVESTMLDLRRRGLLRRPRA